MSIFNEQNINATFSLITETKEQAEALRQNLIQLPNNVFKDKYDLIEYDFYGDIRPIIIDKKEYFEIQIDGFESYSGFDYDKTDGTISGLKDDYNLLHHFDKLIKENNLDNDLVFEIEIIKSKYDDEEKMLDKMKDEPDYDREWDERI